MPNLCPEMEILPSGSCLWRDVEVEHYSYNDDQEVEFQAAVDDLELRCRHLERLGVPVTCQRAIWNWDWFKDMTADEPLKDFLIQSPQFYQEGITKGSHDRRLAASVPGIPGGWNEEFAPTGRIGWIIKERFYIWDGSKLEETDWEPEEFRGWYHVLEARGWFLADCGQEPWQGTVYASLEGVREFLTRHGYPNGG